MDCATFSKHVERSNIAGVELVLNCNNGAIVGLTEEGANTLDQLARGEIDLDQAEAAEPNLLSYLKKAGYFDRDNVTPGRTSRMSVYYHITQNCNLNCAGCYSKDKFRNRNADVTMNMICKGLDKLSELPIESMTFSGGEPFLRQDIEKILRYAKIHCKFQVVKIITNGLVLNEDVISRIAPYVDEIAVSFDGFSENARSWIRGKQNFKKLLSAVQMIKRAGIQPHIISTIHAKNIDDIDACCQFSNNLDIPYHFSLFSYDESRLTEKGLVFSDSSLAILCDKLLSAKNKEGKTFLDLVSAVRAKKTCGCGLSNLSIGYDGSIYPCHMLHDDKFSIGNLYTDFEKGEDIFLAICDLKPCKASVDEIDGCKECEFRYVCGGGCRARSFFSHGDLDKKDPYCILMKRYYGKIFKGLASQ